MASEDENDDTFQALSRYALNAIHNGAINSFIAALPANGVLGVKPRPIADEELKLGRSHYSRVYVTGTNPVLSGQGLPTRQNSAATTTTTAQVGPQILKIDYDIPNICSACNESPCNSPPLCSPNESHSSNTPHPILRARRKSIFPELPVR